MLGKYLKLQLHSSSRNGCDSIILSFREDNIKLSSPPPVGLSEER